MNYKMMIKAGSLNFRLPVLPEKISVKSSGSQSKFDVLGLGEIVESKGLSLKTVKFKSYIPAEESPVAIIQALQVQRSAKKPTRLILVGFDLDVNREFLIDGFDYYEKSGEVGDVYYEISLTEYKKHQPRKLEFKPGYRSSGRVGVVSKVAVEKKKTRPGKQEIPETYNPGKNDTVWSVSKKMYGTDEGMDSISQPKRRGRYKKREECKKSEFELQSEIRVKLDPEPRKGFFAEQRDKLFALFEKAKRHGGGTGGKF